MLAMHSSNLTETEQVYHKCAVALILQYVKETMPAADETFITAPDGTRITMPYAVQTLEQMEEFM